MPQGGVKVRPMTIKGRRTKHASFILIFHRGFRRRRRCRVRAVEHCPTRSHHGKSGEVLAGDAHAALGENPGAVWLVELFEAHLARQVVRLGTATPLEYGDAARGVVLRLGVIKLQYAQRRGLAS